MEKKFYSVVELFRKEFEWKTAKVSNHEQLL